MSARALIALADIFYHITSIILDYGNTWINIYWSRHRATGPREHFIMIKLYLLSVQVTADDRLTV